MRMGALPMARATRRVPPVRDRCAGVPDASDGVTPHLGSKVRYSALDGRTTRQAGDQVSQRMRRRVEELFGWLKRGARMKTRGHRNSFQNELLQALLEVASHARRASRISSPAYARRPTAPTAVTIRYDRG
jgi:hypothetical protein